MYINSWLFNIFTLKTFFRYLNEQFYSSSSEEALLYFKKEPSAFKAYHNGYMQQVIQWPVKPLSVIIKQIKPM